MPFLFSSDLSFSFIHQPLFFVAGGASITKNLTETYDVTDTITRALVLTRLLTDSYNVTDTVARSQVLTRALTDNYNVVDSVTRLVIFTRTLTDSYNVTDAVTKVASHPRTLTESYNVTDTIARAVRNTRTLTDSYNVTDAVTRLVRFTRTLTDNYNVTDTITRAVRNTRTLSESYNVTDTLSVQVTHFRNINESYNVTDTISRSQVLVRQLNESYNVTDSVTRLVSFLRTLTDNYNVIDSVNRSLVLLRSLSESYNVTDTINRLVAFQRLISESYNVIDTLVRSQILTRLLTDSYNVTDTVSSGNVYLKTIDETYNVTDTLTKTQNLTRPLTDSYNVDDTINRSQTLNRSLTDNYNITDSVNRSLSLFKNLTDSFNVTDTVNRLQQLVRLVTDTYNVSETIIRQALINRTLTDNYNVTDIVNSSIAGNSIFRDLTESYSISDTVSISQILTRLITDSYDVVDQVTKEGGEVIFIEEFTQNLGGGEGLRYDLSRLKTKIITSTISSLLPEAFPESIQINNQRAWFLNDKLGKQTIKLNKIKASVKVRQLKYNNRILANIKTRKQYKIEQDAYRHIELLEQNKISTQEFIDKIPNEIRYININPKTKKILNYKAINRIRCNVKVNNHKELKNNRIKANIILDQLNTVPNSIKSGLIPIIENKYNNNIKSSLILVNKDFKNNTIKSNLVLSSKYRLNNNLKINVLNAKKHITKKLGTLLLKKTQLTYDVIMQDILKKAKSDTKEHLLYKLQNYQTKFDIENTKTNIEMKKLERKYKKPTMELYTKIAEEYKDDLTHFGEARIKYKKEAHDILRSVAQKGYNIGIEYVSKATEKEDIFITQTDLDNVKNKTDEAVTHFFDSVEKHIKSRQYHDNSVWYQSPQDNIEDYTQNLTNVPYIDLPSEEMKPLPEDIHKSTTEIKVIDQVDTNKPEKPFPIEDSVILLLNSLSTLMVALATFSKISQIQDLFAGLGIGVRLVYVTEADDRVCKICTPYDYRLSGISYKIDDFGSVLMPRIPQHFRCRCRFLLKMGNKIIRK